MAKKVKTGEMSQKEEQKSLWKGASGNSPKLGSLQSILKMEMPILNLRPHFYAVQLSSP